jgi:hypothetical protein
VFDCDRHQRLDEPIEQNLAGKRSRSFEHRADIELLDGCPHRDGRRS